MKIFRTGLIHIVKCYTCKEFWVEIVVYSCCIINCISLIAIEGKTPINIWFIKLAIDYDSLYIFGSIAYFHMSESKLDLRVKKKLFMGLNVSVKRLTLVCLDLKKVILSRDMTFEESTLLKHAEKNYSQDEKILSTLKNVEFEITSITPTMSTKQIMTFKLQLKVL